MRRKITETTEKKEENDAWSKIIGFEERQWKNLRQDMFASNKPEFTEDELHLSNNATYDSHKEFETRVYLTKLLITAHALNDDFQASVKEWINDFSRNAKFQRAPVKLLER